MQELESDLEKDDYFNHPQDTHLLFHDLNELIMHDLEFYKQLAYTSALDFVWTQMQDALVNTIKEIYSGMIEASSDEMDVYACFYASGVLSVYIAWLKGEIPVDIDRLGEIVANVTHIQPGVIF